MEIFLQILFLVLSIALVVKSADYFVEGASAIAVNLNASKVTIGIFILGFGTSAPEMIVSAIAAWSDLPGLAVGNVIGSNIANLGLVLSIAAIITPIAISHKVFRFETMLMVAATIIVLLLLLIDQHLSWIDSIIMLVLLVSVLTWMLKKNGTMDDFQEQEFSQPMSISITKASWMTLISLIVLMASAQWLVSSASNLARIAGLSETFIGLTIVAIGTSLPELAAAISASIKKHTDLTIGNVIGSNLFNLLAVLPIPGLISGYTINDGSLQTDLYIMLFITLLVPLLFLINRKRQLNRLSGILLLTIYIAFIALLYFRQF